MFELGALRFRPIEREDLKLLKEWENDFELIMYSRSRPINFVNMSQLEKQYEEWVKDEKHLRFIVELTDGAQPIGISRLHQQEWSNVKTADIGAYIGKKELWGKGIGQQITVALLEMAFNQLNVDRCEAWSVEYNSRAHRTLERCGFKKVGVVRKAAYVNGRKWDGYYFDILREEYSDMRMDLLKQTLGDRLDEYFRKYCTV